MKRTVKLVALFIAIVFVVVLMTGCYLLIFCQAGADDNGAYLLIAGDRFDFLKSQVYETTCYQCGKRLYLDYEPQESEANITHG